MILGGQGAKAGSSPLARGLREVAGGDDARGRIIPARAGFTRISHRTRSSTPDHPRSRGVYLLKTFVVIVTLGSSPLARGLR